jgi:hypothetical protein
MPAAQHSSINRLQPRWKKQHAKDFTRSIFREYTRQRNVHDKEAKKHTIKNIHGKAERHVAVLATFDGAVTAAFSCHVLGSLVKNRVLAPVCSFSGFSTGCSTSAKASPFKNGCVTNRCKMSTTWLAAERLGGGPLAQPVLNVSAAAEF